MGICTALVPKRKKKTSSEMNGITAMQGEGESEESITMIVQRSKVVEWAEKNGVELTNVVREEGFLGEWALSDLEDSSSSDSASAEPSKDNDDDKDTAPSET
jgi:hypothetical protein